MPRPGWILVAAVALAAAIVAARPDRAEACSCTADSRRPNPGARHVFEARVTALKHDPSRHAITATLAIGRVLRGRAPSPPEAVTIDAGSMCGFEFRVGEDYLLYADSDEVPVHVSLCSPSKLLAEAGEDLALLAGAPPPLATSGPAPAPAPAAVGGAGGAAPPPPEPAEPPSLPSPEPRASGCAGCSLRSVPEGDEGALWVLTLLIIVAWPRLKRETPFTR
jgi:hypothetical protein